MFQDYVPKRIQVHTHTLSEIILSLWLIQVKQSSVTDESMHILSTGEPQPAKEQ